MFDETDKQIEFYLGDEFVSWKDQLEGTREFLKEIDAKKVMHETKFLKKGDHLIKNFKGGIDLLDFQEIQYDTKSFNPLDATNVRLQETHINKTYIEQEDLGFVNAGDGNFTEDSGLTIGTTETSENTQTDQTEGTTTDGVSSDSN